MPATPKLKDCARVLLVEGQPAGAAPAPTTGVTSSVQPTSAAPSSAATAPNDEPKAAQVVLIGVNQEIRPGLTYPVTLTFQKAGSVTVAVPVGNPTTPRTGSAPG